MSDEAPTVASAPSGSGEHVAAEVGSEASVTSGIAPGGGDDARATEGAAAPSAEASAASVAEFVFGNRSFRDQKHAEEIFQSEIGRTRGLQRQNSEVTRERDGLRAELQALRGLVPKPGNGQGQDSAEKQESFAEKLAKRQDGLAFYESLAFNKDGTFKPGGLQQALYALVQDSDKHNTEELDKRFNELRSEMGQEKSQTQAQHAIARAYTAHANLVSEFPELDEANQSEEAQAAQDAVMQLLQSGPQVANANGVVASQGVHWLATNPGQALRWAASEVRRTYGTPRFAQAPGTSGSPSASAARAAEAAGAATASEPLDGSGVPRQRPNGQAMTLEDKWRNDKPRTEARTKGGRPLGFSEPM